MTRVLSPCDVAGRVGDGPFLLGGRLVEVTDAGLVLADAYEKISVFGSKARRCHPGDIVQCRVSGPPTQVVLQEILDHRRPPAGADNVEFSRLSADGRAMRLKARSRAISAIRRYFEDKDFCEVDTPAFAVCPGLDPHVHSLSEVSRGQRVDHLITSPEFHMKRLVAGGMPRIYQLARCFRGEEIGPLHEPEFTLLEWYRAFASWHDVMDDTEAIVRLVFDEIASSPLPSDLEFRRLSVSEAFLEYGGVQDVVALVAKDEEGFFRCLLEDVEPALVEDGRPAFLTHYPVAMAGLARPCPDDPRFAERFELVFRGVELCNGYGELTDAAIQRGRFETELTRRAAAGEAQYPIDERFLRALQSGLPPCAGNALGVERLIALASGVATIAEVMPFCDAER